MEKISHQSCKYLFYVPYNLIKYEIVQFERIMNKNPSFCTFFMKPTCFIIKATLSIDIASKETVKK